MTVGLALGAAVGASTLAIGAARVEARRVRVRARLGMARHRHPWPPPVVADALEAVGLRPVGAWATALAAIAVLALVVASRLAGPVGMVGLAVAALAARPALRRVVTARLDTQAGAALPGAVDAVARSIRAGRSLQQAVAEAGTTTGGWLGAELAEVARRTRDGAPLADALAAWRARRPSREVRLVAAALELCAQAGGSQARALDGVAATVRDELAMRAEVRAQAAQARVSAVVIVLAPLAFTAVTCTADPASARFLFRTPAGLACLGIGVGLDLLAAVCMRHLTRVAAWAA